MKNQKFDVNKLRVAAPCSVGWETMSGDERVRHCHSCKLDIYNIEEMSETEVRNLIATHEGRLCIRLYRRADGTVLTKDCPVGLRAYRKKAARLAGAALTTILGLFSISYGQADSKKDKKAIPASKVKIIRTANQNQESVLSGMILDEMGAVIPGAEITLISKGKKDKKIVTRSNDEGEYNFGSLSAGLYVLEAKSQGFNKTRIIDLEIKYHEKSQLDITLEVSKKSVTVGVYVAEPLIDTTSSTVTTKITKRMIDNLPY